MVVVGGGWIFTQRRSISAIERETESLIQQVEVAKAAIPQIPGALAVATPLTGEVENKAFDWQEILSRQIGNYGVREAMDFQKRLEGMTAGEIAGALDKIAALDVSEESRRKLARMFLPVLGKKDPEMALSRFPQSPESRADSSVADNYLTLALANWAGTDPAKASAWLDGKIASGNQPVSGGL